MIINFQQTITLLPILIIGLTSIILMLFISWKRNYFISSIITFIGFLLSLVSLYLVFKNKYKNLTFLICIDNFSIFYMALILISTLIIVIPSYFWLKKYSRNKDEFYLLMLISTIGSLLLTCAVHFFTLFIGIELISLPLFGMIGYNFYKKYSLEASIKYMLLSAVSSSFLLLGMSLIYAETGQLSFINIGQIINNNLASKMLLTGIGLMLVGFGFKLSIVPFHLWTPDVYQGSPSPTSIFLATVSKISIFVVLIRLFLYSSLLNYVKIKYLLIIFSFFSIFFGNILAINQKNVKRMLGYSSITHLGYLLIGLITIKNYIFSLEFVNFYLISYLLSTIGIFSILSLISTPYSEVDENIHFFKKYRGLFWSQPLLSISLSIMMLSLAGLPMTIGFIGKFYMLILAMNNYLNFLVIMIIISNIIGFFFYLRFIINLYLPSVSIFNKKNYFFWSLNVNIIYILIISFLIIFFGFFPEPIILISQFSKPILNNF